jgi:hypothetical protein
VAEAAPAPTRAGLGRVELLEAFRNGARLVRVLDGPRRGEVVLAAGDVALEVVADVAVGGAPSAEARARARALLTSLLSERQRDRLERTGTFWVVTPVALVRLGALYDLRVRTRRAPLVERSTCVVTDRFSERPVDDLWTELLAWLAVDPAGFLRVGNPQPCRDQVRAPARRAEVGPWLVRQRERWRSLRADGFEIEAAHLAFEIAHSLERAGLRSWALPFAERAWRQICDEADRFPDDADALRSWHGRLRSIAC